MFQGLAPGKCEKRGESTVGDAHRALSGIRIWPVLTRFHSALDGRHPRCFHPFFHTSQVANPWNQSLGVLCNYKVIFLTSFTYIWSMFDRTLACFDQIPLGIWWASPTVLSPLFSPAWHLGSVKKGVKAPWVTPTKCRVESGQNRPNFGQTLVKSKSN